MSASDLFPLRSMLETFFLIQAFGFSSISYNAPSWSIAAEFWTYITFGLFTLQFGVTRHSLWLAAFISLMAGALLYVMNYPLGLLTALEFGFLRCVCGFFLGALIWRAWRGMVIPRYSRAAMNIALAGVFGVLGLEFAYLDLFTPENFLMLPTFAALIFLCAVDQGSALKTILISRGLRYLGKLSYSIYMLHTAFLIVCSSMVTMFLPALKSQSMASPMQMLLGDAVAVVYVSMIVAAASLTFRYIEVPSRIWGARLIEAKLPNRPKGVVQ